MISASDRPIRRGFAVPSWLIAAASLLMTPAASAYDLDAAFVAAARHDALVQSVRQSVVAARERRAQAQAALRPSLGASAGANHAQADTDISDRRTFNYQTGGLNLNIPIYHPANRSVVDQATLNEQILGAQLAQAEQELINRVATAYFDALAADDAVTVAEAQRTAIAEQFAAAKRNFEVGTATITDQQEAQARLDLNEAQLAAARNERTVRLSALRILTGTDPVPLFPLRRDAALPGLGGTDLESFAGRARDENFLTRQAVLASQVARRQLDQAKYGHYPTLDAVAQAAITRGQTPTTPSPLIDRTATLGAGLQLNIPLYAGGGISAREREVAALVAKSDADLEDARRQVEQAARQVYLGLNSNLEQVSALEAAERSSRLALESNLLGYQVGVRINVDVLNAQQQWFTTRRDLSRARYDVLVNHLRMKVADGSLQPDDVRTVNALLISPELQPRDIETPKAPTGRPGTNGSNRGQPDGARGTRSGLPATVPSAPADQPPPVEPRTFGGVVTKPVPSGPVRQTP